MVGRSITIGHLYPKQMNVYGDMGNVITLRYRLEQRGYDVKYVEVNTLKTIMSTKIDILIGGGGQDSNQTLVQSDVQKYAKELRAQSADGLVSLMICGMYQLYGNRFILSDKTEIKGAGVLDLETRAGDDRLVGNIVIDSEFGQLVGFENHSGRTSLGAGARSLGLVTKGAGNNSTSNEEGAVVNNVFGTYMHGPLLAKNPKFADELIRRALKIKYSLNTELKSLDDFLEQQAAVVAVNRPR